MIAIIGNEAVEGVKLVHSRTGEPLTIEADHVLIRSTRSGDLNLDGSVTSSDFIDLASHFNQIGTATWQEGDLNYDRNVTIADFIDLAGNFNTSYAGDAWPVSAADAAMLADFAGAYGVPEPGVALIMIGAAGGLVRRRSRRVV